MKAFCWFLLLPASFLHGNGTHHTWFLIHLTLSYFSPAVKILLLFWLLRSCLSSFPRLVGSSRLCSLQGTSPSSASAAAAAAYILICTFPCSPILCHTSCIVIVSSTYSSLSAPKILIKHLVRFVAVFPVLLPSDHLPRYAWRFLIENLGGYLILFGFFFAPSF